LKERKKERKQRNIHNSLNSSILFISEVLGEIRGKGLNI